jgi:hypothetical protein
MAKTGKISNKRLYSLDKRDSNPFMRGFMVFRPNYNRDRSERDRVARARSEEKQRKRDEKTAQRKAEREAAQAPPTAEPLADEKPD